MTNKPVIIIGNGGHARVLNEILFTKDIKVLGYTAPEEGINYYNLPYLGDDSTICTYSQDSVLLVNGIGSVSDTSLRAKLFNEFKSQGYFFLSLIHSSAIISSLAELGEGVQILAGVVIQPFAKIDDNTIINTSSVIEHDCTVGKHCHIAPGSVLSGNAYIAQGSHIGTGSIIIQNIKIGNNSLVGAGSLVIKDVLDNKVVYGIPAKEVKK
ncbi:acetyltransferase [Bacillus sp. 31A1R]|uniref:Acetyltransferase n=1 Tax=Robertmurraya mangrovi TaxID=3098077 RepID=A0ABU5IXS8_9BACI|nr:acetyltransferase [Bacillus sp. 31A1R]MDZ5471965.1 acetyltransferase [Bacillus sp. 31A1R]